MIAAPEPQISRPRVSCRAERMLKKPSTATLARSKSQAKYAMSACEQVMLPPLRFVFEHVSMQCSISAEA